MLSSAQCRAVANSHSAALSPPFAYIGDIGDHPPLDSRRLLYSPAIATANSVYPDSVGERRVIGRRRERFFEFFEDHYRCRDKLR